MEASQDCDAAGLTPAVAASVLVGVVLACAGIAGYVAYRIGVLVAVRRLKAFKTLQKAQDQIATARAKKANERGSGGITRQSSRASYSASLTGTLNSMESGTFTSSADLGDSRGLYSSANVDYDKATKKQSKFFDSIKTVSLTKEGRKKRDREKAKSKAANANLSSAMKSGSVEDLRVAIAFCSKEGANEILLDAASILYDRLVAGFLGLDLKPDEQPFHVKKDLPLAKKMGTLPVGGSRPEATTSSMPGYVSGPSSPSLPVGASHEEVKLRGFMAKTEETPTEEDTELASLLPAKDDRRGQYEEVAWLAVPRPGGGVKYYNYVARKTRDEHASKLSREFHFRPESRLRIAEDTIVAMVEEMGNMEAKAAAATTQVQLLKDEVKANTRHRWFSNHRSRWHDDPATTLQIDWGQLAGVTAKACVSIVNGSSSSSSKTSNIDSIDDAVGLAQLVCEKVLSGMGLAAYVAYTGIIQDRQLICEASATDGTARVTGRTLSASDCKLTYLAKAGSEIVHIDDVRADDRVFFWRGYPTGSGAFAAIPIRLPSSKRTVGVLNVDSLHRVPLKAISTVELDALEAIAASLASGFEQAEMCERATIRQGMLFTAKAMEMTAPTQQEQATKGIAMACAMQGVEQRLRSSRFAHQLEPAVIELERLESPTKAAVGVCAALLLVIDYDRIIRDLESKGWVLPAEYAELHGMWHDIILPGMMDISRNLLMVFDHLSPTDISVQSCLRFERAEAVLASVKAKDLQDAPVLLQLLYQWLVAAQDSNNHAVMLRESEMAAKQYGESPPGGDRRPGQVTAEILCDIICKRFT